MILIRHKYAFFCLFSLVAAFAIHAMEQTSAVCAKESLADPEFRKTLRTQFLFGRLKGKRKPTEEDYLDLCLGGVSYTAIGRRGGGLEGEVYKIKDSFGKKFALKVYEAGYKYWQKGDLLALKKAKKLREFLNMPVIVDTEEGYTIYPLLKMPYKLKKDHQKLKRFEAEMNMALAQDGLGIGDPNPGNYMYDKEGRLWRIDLSALYELKPRE